MPNDYAGFAALGDLVTGGPGRRAQGEYYKGVRESANAFEALDEARIRRAQAMARDALPRAIESAGMQHPELAAAILGMAAGQPNLNSLTEGYKDLGDIELERQELDAFKSGNIRLANQLAAVRDDKAAPYEPVRQLGGNLLPSGVALGDPDFSVQPLPQTSALVDLRGAQKAKALRPPAARASSGGSTPKAEDVELANARAAMQAGVPRAKVVAKMRARGFGALAKKL